jgi:hypothetical protein
MVDTVTFDAMVLMYDLNLVPILEVEFVEL